uniref:Ubiquitin-like protease family profile domain-containing protein n=1 Tax=Xiphophorus couchianus TaxID=32473 RepID=A0A3B5LUQ1_9TELE
MVHSSSNSPMTTPSASPHLTVCSKAPLSVSCPRGATEQDLSQTSTDPTSVSELPQPLAETPAEAHHHVATATRALSTKSSSASSSPSTPAPTSAQDQLNGRRSGRKRTPKACDCCGPNSRGHNVETPGRGRGNGKGRGRGKGRGANRDFGDTPARKPLQLTGVRNINLSGENIQETEDEDDRLGNLQSSDTKSQSPATKAAPPITQDGPKNNCAAQTNGAALKMEDILMEPSGFAVAIHEESVDKKDVDPTVLGPVHEEAVVAKGRGRGAGMGRGRGRGAVMVRGRGRGRGVDKGQDSEQEKMEGIPISSKDKDYVTSSRTGKFPIENGELVHLSDSEDEMEEDTIIVTELGDGVLTIPRKSATRSEISGDLDSEMQVDQTHDGIEQVSLPVPLPNGNVVSQRNHDLTSSPVEGKMSSSTGFASLNPISVSMNKLLLTSVFLEFLESFYIKYGSFIPLAESDVLEHLKKTSNSDLSNRLFFFPNREHVGLLNYCFMVTYNKHNLRLEDLGTLEDQNWLNDQVKKDCGYLCLICQLFIFQVHFFNSFFYKQLVAKGYEGVKRWTKKVDLFSKWLLLIPIHLEIHWSLIAITMATKTISYYDSQGIVFRHTTNNIMKYLQSEAREKKQAAFQKGWKIAIIKTNHLSSLFNIYGSFSPALFVFTFCQYCRRLSVKQPLLFSQNNMPQIRKRIYKELCDCRLND